MDRQDSEQGSEGKEMKRFDKTIQAFIIIMMFVSLGMVVEATGEWYVLIPILVYWGFAIVHMFEKWFPKNCTWLESKDNDTTS